MKERPILFSGEMVRAILEGRKTQTRRVVRKQPPDLTYGDILDCPYGVPGDRLWVRESFGLVWPDGMEDGYVNDDKEPEGSRPIRPEECVRQYRADAPENENPGQWPKGDPDITDGPRWKPSIHMPRWASRLLLEIVAVRVERIQEIAAGESDGICGRRYRNNDAWVEGFRTPNPVAAFMVYWDRLNAKRGFGWEVNPFVWVLTFKRVEG